MSAAKLKFNSKKMQLKIHKDLMIRYSVTANKLSKVKGEVWMRWEGELFNFINADFYWYKGNCNIFIVLMAIYLNFYNYHIISLVKKIFN